MYPDFEIEQVVLFNIYGKQIDEIATNIKTLTEDEVNDHTDRFYQHLYDFQTGVKEVFSR